MFSASPGTRNSLPSIDKEWQLLCPTDVHRNQRVFHLVEATYVCAPMLLVNRTSSRGIKMTKRTEAQTYETSARWFLLPIEGRLFRVSRRH